MMTQTVGNIKDGEYELTHGSVVIAAITSCTNTSNPAVMIGAGLVAKKAVERGLQAKPWVKTSLAPGSKVVTEYLNKSGLSEHLDLIGFGWLDARRAVCLTNAGWGPVPRPFELDGVWVIWGRALVDRVAASAMKKIPHPPKASHPSVMNRVIAPMAIRPPR